MKKKLIGSLVTIVICVAIALGLAFYLSRNTAESEAKNILKDFTSSTSSQWYCENGSGKGFDNQNPWWEEIYVSNVELEATTKKIEEYLKNRQYSVVSKYVKDSQDSLDNGKSYWEVEASHSPYSVKVKVSKVLTANNCFQGISRMDQSIKTENFNSVVVISFRDNS